MYSQIQKNIKGTTIKQATLFGCIIIALTTLVIHGAAHDTPTALITSTSKSDLTDLIGLSVSERGEHALLIPKMRKDTLNRTIILVYSEHPIFKQSNILAHIAAKIAKNLDCKLIDPNISTTITSNDKDKYIINAIIQVLGGKSDLKFLKKKSISLIAHHITLTDTNIQHSGFELDSISGFRRHRSHAANLHSFPEFPITHFSSSAHFGEESYEPLQSSAQDEADTEQIKNPDKPFHLIIDLIKWDAFISEQKIAASANELTKTLIKKPSCLIQ